MGCQPGGLFQQQARLGGGGRNTTTAGFLRESRIVEIGVKPQQRELKPVLAASFTVTGPRIAPESGENGNHVQLKCHPLCQWSIGECAVVYSKPQQAAENQA